MSDTKRAERTAPGTWETIDSIEVNPIARTKILITHVTSKEGYVCEMLSTNTKHTDDTRRTNAAFIVLADHHFDRLEQALRLVRGKLAPAYHCIDDEQIAEELARAEYHIDQVLNSIDKEREGR